MNQPTGIQQLQMKVNQVLIPFPVQIIFSHVASCQIENLLSAASHNCFHQVSLTSDLGATDLHSQQKGLT